MFAIGIRPFAAIATSLNLLMPFGGEHAVSRTRSEEAVVDGTHDFDFLFGHWMIRNRRLRHPLTGSTEWYEFTSTASETPLLGGLANLEQYDAPDAPGKPIHAIAVRLYSVEMRQWSINWGTAGEGAFETPMVGKFEGGVGLFYDREEYNGRPITVRFIWSHVHDAHCRWEQAFSADDGRTWEPNWVMDFTRAK